MLFLGVTASDLQRKKKSSSGGGRKYRKFTNEPSFSDNENDAIKADDPTHQENGTKLQLADNMHTAYGTVERYSEKNTFLQNGSTDNNNESEEQGGRKGQSGHREGGQIAGETETIGHVGHLDQKGQFSQSGNVDQFQKVTTATLTDINTEVTLKTYLRSIIHLPRSLLILCITNLFCWMSLVCYSLYFTDFVGQAVYGGNPNEPYRTRFDI